jgi:cell division protein FtsB
VSSTHTPIKVSKVDPDSEASFKLGSEKIYVQASPAQPHVRNIDDNTKLARSPCQSNQQRNFKMATAKKTAPKAPTNPTVTAPAKVAKPAAKAAAKKAPVSKEAKAIAKLSASIAKLTERKDKLNAEINALRDQRTALKAAPVSAPTPASAPVAKATAKAAVPAKAAKPAAAKK